MDKYLNNIDLILTALSIRFERTVGRYFFECPIHGSNNYNSLSIYENTGKWRCFTRHCEHEHGDNFLQFVQAVLEVNPFDNKDAQLFCDLVLEGLPPDVLERPKQEVKKEKFKEISREQILPYVNPLLPFYLRRGYSPEILKKYDLYIENERTNLLYGRIVVPVYNDEHTHAIGLLGRTLFDRCENCRLYHSSTRNCPIGIEKVKCGKWLNAKGFSRNTCLFNYWFAHEEIKRTKKVILVESPGNTIKLAQAGILNSVAIFGTELTKKQIEKLNNSGAKQVYLGLDNDDAGLAAWDKISWQLKDFELIPFIPFKNDFGDMSDEDIRIFSESYL